MTEQQEQPRKSPDRRRVRTSAVVAATVAPVAVWFLAEFAFGIDVHSPAFGPDQPSEAIGPFRVALTALVMSAAGWGLLVALERVTQRARALWTAIAAIVLVVSLGGPFGGEGITTANQTALALMHVAVGAVLIPRLYRSAAPRQPRESVGRESLRVQAR